MRTQAAIMPLEAADSGYGALNAPGTSGARADVSEAAPLLLVPDPELEESWRPMDKEELERKAGGPGWTRVRFYLVLLFWVTWLLMLVASVVLVYFSPRPVVTPLRWWQRSLFYQLQLDADAHGGRSEGITALCAQFPHLKSLGYGALILEGLFHRNGSSGNLTGENMETWPQIHHLLGESNRAGLRVVLDFCHVDDLDHRAENSSERLENVQNTLRFWLDQGVSGFAICDTDVTFSEQTLLMWRSVFHEFNHEEEEEEEERIIVLKQTSDVLPSLNTTLVDLVMRSLLPSSSTPLSSQEVAVAIETDLQRPGVIWPSWTVGGHASDDLKKLLLVLTMTLPGSPVVQYDEDLEQKRNFSVASSPTESNTTTHRKKKNLSSGLFASLSHSRSREEALLYGNFTFLPFTPSNSSSSPPVLAFLRSWGCVHFLVLLNIGSESKPLDPSWARNLPEGGVFVVSTGMDRQGPVSLCTLKVKPREAVVIKLFQSGKFSS